MKVRYGLLYLGTIVALLCKSFLRHSQLPSTCLTFRSIFSINIRGFNFFAKPVQVQKYLSRLNYSNNGYRVFYHIFPKKLFGYYEKKRSEISVMVCWRTEKTNFNHLPRSHNSPRSSRMLSPKEMGKSGASQQCAIKILVDRSTLDIQHRLKSEVTPSD